MPGKVENAKQADNAVRKHQAAQPAAQLDQLPVVRTLIHEKGLARRDTVDIDLVVRKIIGEGLLDIENHLVDARMILHQPVEDLVHIGGFGDRAVEVAGQPQDTVRLGHPTDLDQTLQIPDRIVPSQFDLKAR